MPQDVLKSSTFSDVVNLAAYKFVPLSNLSERRERLKVLCRSLELKGTILLSVEGINLFVAGEAAAVSQLVNHLKADAEIGDLDLKRSPGNRQPFSRMLVKIKKEIIAFGIAEVNPVRSTSPKISPQELRQWLDEGRPCVLLDVRNDYEVRLGTFENAVPIGIDHFRNFPQAVAHLPEELSDKPIVMFCTGGIRCEKAGPFMARAGFRHVVQLEGGILKYFEECGSEHYKGECFVFDHRVAIDASLEETDTTICFACQHPLTAEEQKSPLYVLSEHCPYCYAGE